MDFSKGKKLKTAFIAITYLALQQEGEETNIEQYEDLIKKTDKCHEKLSESEGCRGKIADPYPFKTQNQISGASYPGCSPGAPPIGITCATTIEFERGERRRRLLTNASPVLRQWKRLVHLHQTT